MQPGLRELLAGLLEDMRGGIFGCSVGTGDHDQAVLNSQRGERISVVAGLRLPPLVGGDDEADHRRRAEAGQRVAQEAMVAGHIDECDLASRRERGPGEAEVDGQPAPTLLLPAVGFHAGEGPDEGALAVVDVAGGGRQRVCSGVRTQRHAYGDQQAIVVGFGDAPQVEQARAVVHPGQHRGVSDAQGPGRGLGKAHRPSGQGNAGGSPTADSAVVRDDGRTHRVGETLAPGRAAVRCRRAAPGSPARRRRAGSPRARRG